jgi:hypothetical protein
MLRKGPAGKRRQAGSPARVGPTTRIRPAAGLRAHRRQPKGRAGAIWRRRSPREPEPGLWASLCSRSHDAANDTAPVRLHRAISCRTVSGTGRGAGVDRPDLHGRGQFGAKRQYTSGTDKQVSGRREAKRERRPAGLRRVRPGGWALPLTIEERPGGARTAGNCRIMYPALLRGGLTPGRSCRESNLARSASLGRDAENNAPGQDLKQKRKLIPFIRIKSVMSKSREALSAKPPGHIRCIISSGITIKYKVSFEQFMSKDQASAREEPHTPQSPD